MGLFSFGKKSDKNTPVRSAEQVRQHLLALNRETAPYHIMDGASENVDLIAEWKIAYAPWHEIFAKANLSKVFRVYMKLDEVKHEVRAKDEEYTVEGNSNPGRSINIALARTRSRNQSRKWSLPVGGAIKAWHLESFKAEFCPTS